MNSIGRETWQWTQTGDEPQQRAGISAKGGNSPVARECVVELVGLEPTTRVLWNVGVSDQLTLSDTRHSSSKRAAIDGNFYNREIFGCRHAGMESPGVPRTTAAFFPPDGTTSGRLRFDRPSAPVEAASHDLTVVRLLSVPGVRQGELVGHPHIP